MDKLKDTVKEWVRLDGESQQLKKRIREITLAKKKLSVSLLAIMSDKGIDEFDLNTEGKLVRQTKKSKQPINKKTLLAALTTYYNDSSNAETVTGFILESRENRSVDVLCKKN